MLFTGLLTEFEQLSLVLWGSAICSNCMDLGNLLAGLNEVVRHCFGVEGAERLIGDPIGTRRQLIVS